MQFPRTARREARALLVGASAELLVGRMVPHRVARLEVEVVDFAVAPVLAASCRGHVLLQAHDD